ncbi:hypothetical protein MACK_003304 [Theileria orientalis]|uniref:Uncharacterized protein n=1 Tax=Theileria orientalis TaxID=68886 RepID=A0A976XJ39_THEOR|nr:hypothetical protein MACK_003304 [Theileria orientalis]
MFYVHLDYDLFDNDFWSPYKVKTASYGNNIIDDAIIGIILCFLVWVAFTLANKVLSHNYERAERIKRLIVYGILGVCVYSIVKSALLSEEVSLLIDKLLVKVDNTINYYKWKLRFLKHNWIVRRVIALKNKVDMGITNISNSEDLVTKISEFFIFMFLVMVLFIFFVITKCTNDSRSLIVFIFKDFLFIIIISSMFLFYRRLFTLNTFKWSPFMNNILWKDYDF